MNKVKMAEVPEAGQATERQLADIARFARRKLLESEVFVFSVILCDNEVDRDCERFPVASLEKLGELYLGKTGVFDHNTKAENQSARIFSTKVVQSGDKHNSLGEVYVCLQAWAYMVRCDKNNDLILEIDAGIKKEVSVGCSVGDAVCSVCGKSRKTGCSHKKGKIYNGAVCHDLLVDPTDAYEWSFVAVPAQKNAGVTKKYTAFSRKGDTAMNLEKYFGKPADADITIIKEQQLELSKQFQRLSRMAAAGEEYVSGLRRQVIKLGLLSQRELDPAVMEAVAGKMDIPELRAFEKAFAYTAKEHFPIGEDELSRHAPSPQTAGADLRDRTDTSMTQFKV